MLYIVIASGIVLFIFGIYIAIKAKTLKNEAEAYKKQRKGAWWLDFAGRMRRCFRRNSLEN